MKLLLTLFVSLGFWACQYEYAIVKPGEPETIIVTETVTETVTVTEEVEVPVYIEVEVPVYIGDTAEDDPGLIWVDSFTQHMSTDGIDILWVIDRSGSMNRYNPELLAGVEAMLHALPVSDWRLVMISADPTRSITSTEFPLVPGDDIDDAAAMLATLAMAPWEEGFNSVYEYVNHNPYSSTWMRPEAGLLVVFVSDEEEQSEVEYPMPADFLGWYGSLRMGSVFMASVVNVASAISECTHPVSPIDIGNRYMDATHMLSGVVVDICSEDWSPGVTDATHSIEPIEQVALTHQAVADSVRVFINGSLDAYGWYYQESDNTVYFTAVPTADQLVEIGYRYMTDTGT